MKKWQIVSSVVLALAAMLSLAVVAFAQTPMPTMGYGIRMGMNDSSLARPSCRLPRRMARPRLT